MARRILGISWSLVVLILMAALSADAQSFRVQCPTSTITHPTAVNNNSEPTYNGPTVFTTNSQGYVTPTAKVNGAIKCQQVSGGDGYMTEADGTQTFMFSFGPLSGLADIAAGRPGTSTGVMGMALGGSRTVSLRNYYLEGVVNGGLVFRAGTVVCGALLIAAIAVGMVAR